MGIFTLPSLGSDMDAGTLVEWLIAPGDNVHRGDVVAVIETQKGAIEIECYEEGIVHALLVEPGTKMPVGASLAVLLEPGETAPDDTTVATPTAAAPILAADTPNAPPKPAMVPPPGTVAASPAARLRARELKLDLKEISGSFPGGAVVLADVNAAADRSAADTAKTASSMDEMRAAIAASMTRSKQTIPHFYLSHTIDVQPAMDWLQEHNKNVRPADRMLLGAMFVRAAVKAAEETPVLNGHYIDGAFQASSQVNAAFAVALRGGGLVAPALIDAHTMSLSRTMAGIRDLVTRARSGKLRSSEMTCGTITISGLGETGSEAMAGIIFPPQVALVCMGAPQLRPWLVNGEVVPRHVVTLTLSVDHRVSDGRLAAKFIAEFEQRITNPSSL